MRNYPSLAELLRKETTNPNPRQSAAAILGKAPKGATDAVLFADRKAEHWVVYFVPSEGLPTLPAAARARVSGRPAVATCPVPRDRSPEAAAQPPPASRPPAH